MQHDVRIEIDGQTIRPPLSYSFDIDILTPCDAWRFVVPADGETWELAALDAPVKITIDGIQVMAGWVDDVQLTDNDTIRIQGRDRVSRLIDESVVGAGFNVGGRRLSEVMSRLVDPWFDSVTFSNATDRRLRRGRGKRALSGNEPALTRAQYTATPRHIDAGSSRWAAIEKFLRPLSLTAWSGLDGSSLVVASPNYTQGVSYSFQSRPGERKTNVISLDYSKSLTGRYRTVEVSGTGRAPGVPAPPFFPAYPGQKRPKNVNRSRIGVARDESDDFQRGKRLFITDESLTREDAQLNAARILAEGASRARALRVRVPGLGQRTANNPNPTLYTPDTIADVVKSIRKSATDDSEFVVISERYYITSCSYSSSRTGGEETELSMVPVGTRLV